MLVSNKRKTIELINAYENFKILIGKGSFGKVYLGRHKVTGKLVAFKVIKYDKFGIPIEAVREIGTLKGIDHENIVKLLDIFYTNNKVILVFDYIPNNL